MKTEMERSRAMSNASSSPALLPYNHNFTDEDLNDILGATLMEDAKAVEEAPGSANSGAEDDDEDDSGKVQARSERKRSREKQRRSDVNKQFADLTQLLRRIESEEEGRTVVPMSSASATNRVDLIARTITTMQRTHELCKKRKTEIESLQKQLEESHKMTEDTAARLKEATLYQQPGLQKQVMMMVPMMVNPDTMGGAQSGTSAGAYPHPMMPQMMTHPYMMPQMPSHQSSAVHPHMMMPQMMFMPQTSQGPQTSVAVPPLLPQPQVHHQQQQSQPQQQQQSQLLQQQVSTLQQPQTLPDDQPKTGQTQNVPCGNLANCA